MVKRELVTVATVAGGPALLWGPMVAEACALKLVQGPVATNCRTDET